MKIAVVGCGHGFLDRIYQTIREAEEDNKIKVDLLLICGDFQAVRNPADMHSMAIPQRHWNLGDFYKYYSGETVAPVLTIVVGGNHEASSHMIGLPFGGWLAPKIYYMGHAGIVNVNGIRIGGISGIYKKYNYRKGHFETSPLNEDTKRSIYHIREFEIFEMSQVSSKIDIIMSHDWPNGIVQFGDSTGLIRQKPHFRKDISENSLGCHQLFRICKLLKPKWWFAAHLHVKFAALVPHEAESRGDSNEIDLDALEEEEEEEEKDKETRTDFTRFLALSKCEPNRDFLQIVDVGGENEGEVVLEHDIEWLSIVKQCFSLYPQGMTYDRLPFESSQYKPTTDSMDWIRDKLKEKYGSFRVPENFVLTVSPYDPSNPLSKKEEMPTDNPQLTEFYELLELPRT